METKFYWLFPLVLNIIIYGICIFIILKRKRYTIISIRSPTLLLITLFSNFMSNEVIILYKVIDSNYFSSFFYFFRFMMLISFLLRYERIITCGSIYKNIILDSDKFHKKRDKFVEKYFVKILFFIIVPFFITICAFIIIKKDYVEIFFVNSNSLDVIKLYVWIAWNFLEQGVLMTYIFRVYFTINLQHYVKTELYIYFGFLFVYTNFTVVYTFLMKNELNFSFLILMTMLVLYINLIISGFVPLVLSYRTNNFHFFQFPNKLLNNLYLFLTNAECYKAFKKYLIGEKDDDDLFYLRLYIYIMKYRLNFVIGSDQEKIFNDAADIYEIFFKGNKNSRLIFTELLLKVREEFKTFNSNPKNRQYIFDEALQFAFQKLNDEFEEFKTSKDYYELGEKMNAASFVNCKMINTGLINKY